MSTRLNWDTPLGAMRYDGVATFAAAFHVMADQDLAMVLTKEEFIARAVCAYDKLGPDPFTYPDQGNITFPWITEATEIPDDLLSLAYRKVGCPHSERRDPMVMVKQGECGMFTWVNCGTCEDVVCEGNRTRLDFS